MRFAFRKIWQKGLGVAVACFAITAHGQTIILSNSWPFAIAQPVSLPCTYQNCHTWVDAGRTSGDVRDGRSLFVARIPAHSTETLQLTWNVIRTDLPLIQLKNVSNGVSIRYQDKNLGGLRWELALGKTDEPKSHSVRIQQIDSDFTPLPLQFEGGSYLNETAVWQAQAVRKGLAIEVKLRCWISGFMEIQSTLTNMSGDAKSISPATLVCRWNQPPQTSNTLGHGDQWIRSSIKNVTTGWMNDNAPQVNQTMQVSSNRFYNSSAPLRLKPGEGVAFNSLIRFSHNPATDLEMENAFLAYTGDTQVSECSATFGTSNGKN